MAKKIFNYSFISLSCVAIVLLFQFFFAEKTVISNGLGWDGVEYARIAKNFEKIISTKNIDLYRIHKIVPSVIMFYFFHFLKILATNNNLIIAFKIYNSILILVSVILWNKILALCKIPDKYKIISLVLMFVNFAFLKDSFYQPVGTSEADMTAFLLGVALLYFYIKKKPMLILFLSVISFFTWPIHFFSAIILFLFPMDVKSGSFSEKQTPVVNKILIILILLTVTSVIIYSVFIIHVVKGGGDQAIKSRYLIISILALLPYLYLAYDFLFSKINTERLLMFFANRANFFKLTACGLIYVGLETIAKHYSGIKSILTVQQYLIRIILMAVTKPFIFYISHVVYFGIIMLLFFIYFKEICGVIRKFSLGMMLLFMFNLVSTLSSEPRTFINIYPFIVFFTIKYLSDAKIKLFHNNFLVIILISSLLSKSWLYIGNNVYLYLLNFGPWMRDEWYALQGIIVFGLFFILVFMKSRVEAKITKR